MKRTKLVVFGILLCLGAASSRLHDFYIEHVPLAREGQCIVLTEGEVKVTVEVIQNMPKEGVAMVVSYTNAAIVYMSYLEMRKLNPKTMECPE